MQWTSIKPQKNTWKGGGEYFNELQWNLFKQNLFGTKGCVQNKQVFDLYRLN